MLRLVENARPKQLRWIRAILDRKKWRPSRLAKEAGIDHSTLSKFLSDADNIAQLGTTTIEKIAALNIIPPYETEPASVPRGMEENEAELYEPARGDIVKSAIDAMRDGSNSIVPWVMNSRALENAGYVRGDVLVVDLNAVAKPGDAVCAQVYDRFGKAETVMRLYEHPFLIAVTQDSSLFKPLLVDNDRVQIRGVVVASVRPRRAA